jgi:hypothetical protein
MQFQQAVLETTKLDLEFSAAPGPSFSATAPALPPKSNRKPVKEPLPTGDLTIQNKASGMFMDLKPAQGQEQFVLWQSARGNTRTQIWKIIPAGELGTYYLVSQNYPGDNRCLEVKPGGVHDRIGLGDIKDAKEQQWELVPADPGYYFIKSKFYEREEKTINVPGSNNIEQGIEQPLIMFSFWRGNNEQWRFAAAD